jgi:hypothetical protein
MSRSDSVDIAGQIQIDLFDWHHLRVPSPRRPPLDSEDRPHRWLAKAADRLFPDAIQAQRKANGIDGLSLA